MGICTSWLQGKCSNCGHQKHESKQCQHTTWSTIYCTQCKHHHVLAFGMKYGFTSPPINVTCDQRMKKQHYTSLFVPTQAGSQYWTSIDTDETVTCSCKNKDAWKHEQCTC